jgi:phosphatidylcholine synthase
MNFKSEKVRPHARRAAGYSVHVFTASGGAVAVLALYSAIERDFAAMFGWLGLALFIDGVDGTLARAAKVKETAAAIDGATLDFVVDFLTYVLVPVVALWRSDLLPERWSFWLGLGVTMASALYFADSRMKTADHWFRGFPALWNVFVLYLFVFRPAPLVSAIAIVLAAAAMFAPVVFVHPMRVRRLRVATLAVTALWFASATLAVVDRFDGGLFARIGLIVSAIYILVLPMLRHSPWAENVAAGPDEEKHGT